MSENACCKNLWSSIGRKFMTGITGLLLVGFLVAHLIGNYLLLAGADAFNAYAHFLETAAHGMLIIVAEVSLLTIFGFHIISAVKVQLSKLNARSTPYAVNHSAGGKSKRSISSMSMIITGSVLLVFVVLHVIHFKFGETEMVALPHGGAHGEMRDLYSLVVSEFKKPLMVLLYMAVMIMLGSHLRHGVWSAFQSIGATRPNLLTPITIGGTLVAVALTIGFLLIPLIAFFALEPAAIDAATAGGVR